MERLLKFACHGCGTEFEKCEDLATHIIEAKDKDHSGRVLEWARGYQCCREEQTTEKVSLTKLQADTKTRGRFLQVLVAVGVIIYLVAIFCISQPFWREVIGCLMVAGGGFYLLRYARRLTK